MPGTLTRSERSFADQYVLDEAHRLLAHASTRGEVYLTARHLELAESAHGTVADFLAHSPETFGPLIPKGPRNLLVDVADEGNVKPMTVRQERNRILVKCQHHGGLSLHDGGDQGADRAGMAMIHHVLAFPACSGRVGLLGTAPQKGKRP